MKRHYYISDNLDELEMLEQELENGGILKPQMHVLSEDDVGTHSRKLHDVDSFQKKDVIRSAEIGAIVGVIAASAVLIFAYYSNLTDTFTWVPFIFLAIVLLGFCTWEGGLFGIQEPNHDFKRFANILKKGKHVFFVDVESPQEQTLSKIVNFHPKIKQVGHGRAVPHWWVTLQQKWKNFLRAAP